MNSSTKSVLIKMILFTVLLGTMMLTFFMLYHIYHAGWMLSVAITMLTFFYHFSMRLAVGEVVTAVYRNKDFPQNRLGFHQFNFETELYRKLRVKQWKLNVITAKPEQFDIRHIKAEELLHNVMQAELVHRIIMVLSFVPLFFIIPFGEPIVFILTSVMASLFDAVFVVVQRYNRPRVLRYMAIMDKKLRCRTPF